MSESPWPVCPGCGASHAGLLNPYTRCACGRDTRPRPVEPPLDTPMTYQEARLLQPLAEPEDFLIPPLRYLADRQAALKRYGGWVLVALTLGFCAATAFMITNKLLEGPTMCPLVGEEPT